MCVGAFSESFVCVCVCVIEAACVCVCRCLLRELFVNPIIVTMSAQIKPRRRVWGQEDGRGLIRLIKC